MTAVRRPKGEGSIYENRSGVGAPWVGQAWIEDAFGRPRRRKVTGSSRADVARKLQALRSGEAPAASETVAMAADRWCRDKLSRLAPSTQDRRRPIVERIVADLGPRSVGELRSEQVTAWLATVGVDGRQEALARRTIEGYRQVFVSVLNYAIARRAAGVGDWNAARHAALPAECPAPADRRALNPDQARLLLKAMTGQRWAAYFTVILRLGLRPGEADALQWNDLDLEGGTLTVRAALQRGNGGRPLALAGTKTARSVRVLAIDAALVEALAERRLEQEADKVAAGTKWSQRWGDLVFTTELGTPAWGSNLRRQLAAFCEQAGLAPVMPYELRHTAASLLADQDGVSDWAIADMLGHRDTRMLQQHYRHPLRPTVEVGPAALGALLG